LNGIEDAVTRFDLLDRCIALSLPTIPEAKRREESPFWRAFEASPARLLGGLLDAVGGGLEALPDGELDRPPPVGDFRRWGGGVGGGGWWGWREGAFSGACAENRRPAADGAREDSAVARAAGALMTGRDEAWTGTASELLEALTRHIARETTESKSWPKSPN